jgi:NADH-quinone oxidoreductase subunit L
VDRKTLLALASFTVLVAVVAGFVVSRIPQAAAFTILVLPLGGFTVLSLFGDRIRDEGEADGAGILACITVVFSFALSVAEVVHLMAFPEAQRIDLRSLGFDWISVGGLRIGISLLLDPLSAVMILTVTGVSSLIHIYSVGYMAHDEERVRYFSYLNLFVFFMLLLVLARSLPLMFIGWEGVGLCSYLLIGFWYKKKSASDAGKKAFIVNRIGDAGLILGMILAYHAFGTLDFVDLAANASNLVPDGAGEVGVVTAVCLLLFVGACGKSAQLPLHVWLPDAMEGPTPVSALIHAATMVTAGVYLVARLAPLYALSPVASSTVAVVGVATALMAGTVALVQTDIKRVLAYSTVSQLGYMFLACGVGAFGVGVFHLFTHAFFKALLFLGSGSVIHAMGGEQDMRRMGGLHKRLPWTFWTFVVGTLAIAGIPPLSGFVSKDEILAAASHHPVLFALALATALLTAFYMGRLVALTFLGEFRGSEEPRQHLHESPWVMLVPLVALAVGSAVAGMLPWLAARVFGSAAGRLVDIPHLLGSVSTAIRSYQLPHPAWLPYLATVVAVIGLVAAYSAYLLFPDLPRRVRAAAGPVARVLEAKYGFDLAYDGFVRKVVVTGSERVLWRKVDAAGIDGAVNGLGAAAVALARATRGLQAGLARGYVLVILGGAVGLLAFLLWLG